MDKVSKGDLVKNSFMAPKYGLRIRARAPTGALETLATEIGGTHDRELAEYGADLVGKAFIDFVFGKWSKYLSLWCLGKS